MSELIRKITEKITTSIRVSMPGIVEDYDFKTQKADIKIDMQELYEDGSTLDYPVLTGVPVIFPRSGGASVSMPVLRGDTCLVLFLDRDISNWLMGSNTPSSRRKHALSDAVAIMGLNPFNKPSKAKNNSDVHVVYDGSEVTLKPGGVINIQSSKELNIKTENIIVNCTNASIKASGQINTETPNFIQKGKMKIEGDIEVTGASALKGNVKCDASIEGNVIKTSGGINLATHKHSYKEAQNGSNPTIVVPSVTGAGM